VIRVVILGIGLSLALIACAAEEQTTQRNDARQAQKEAVARIGTRTIMASEVACPPDVVMELCPAVRQDRFIRVSRELLLDSAARLHGITVPEEVLNRHTPKVTDDELRIVNEDFKRAARAALRVRLGEDRENVFRQDLAPHGVKMAQFEAVLKRIPDVATARRALEVDPTANARRQLAEDTRQRLAREQLGRFVDGQRLRDGVSYEVAEERFWKDVVDRTGVVIMDPTLQLPNSTLSHSHCVLSRLE
jgi:hypothetical protein